MTAKGHEGAFPRPRLSARCRFSQRTFAGTWDNGRDAPKAVIWPRSVEVCADAFAPLCSAPSAPAPLGARPLRGLDLDHCLVFRLSNGEMK